VSFASVFNKVKKETGPRLPGGPEVAVPAVKAGAKVAPGFSPLAKLAETLPRADNPAFARNMANRLWFVMMGRGLVHPLDMHHRANPPSHPELLDLLASEFAAHRFDIKGLLRELALSRTYQRSSVLPDGGEKLPPESFQVAHEKRLSAEQLLWSTLEAVGEPANVQIGPKSALPALRDKFLKGYANPRREPEDTFAPSLRAALFVLNDNTVLGWLTPRPGNLIDRLVRFPDAGTVAEELYLSVLTRMPTAGERAEVADYLAKNSARRPAALGHLAWALLASTEFCVNH
jgi:hypothetical protein